MKSILALSLILVTFDNIGAADPLALPRKEIDRRLADSLREVINIGAKIYNENGDMEGCYRVYEGALTTALPLLDHRAELKKSVEDALARAKKLPAVEDRAFALRGALDAIRAAIKRDVVPPPKTLWERLGGELGVRPVVRDFLRTAAADKKVNFDRNGKYKLDDKALANLEQKLVEFISEITFGTVRNTGRDMKTVHKDMGITEAEFNAAADDLKASLLRFKVAPKETDELLGLVAKYKPVIVETK